MSNAELTGKEKEMPLQVKMTLLEKVLYHYEFLARKHALGEDYAENEVNKTTNVELLRAISEALEELKGTCSHDR